MLLLGAIINDVFIDVVTDLILVLLLSIQVTYLIIEDTHNNNIKVCLSLELSKHVMLIFI
jgi:hypothetical protein